MGLLGSAVFLDSCKKPKTNNPPQGPTVNFTLDLSQSANASLNNAGGSVASHGVVVANANGTYVAVAQSCTHNGCNVGYNHSANNFVCPCHNGVFDLSGNVTSGPPPTALKNYTVTKNGSVLTIAG